MIAAIVQARMGSTRLPGKALLDIHGQAMLWHVVRRVEHTPMVDTTLVATSREKRDDAIAALCGNENIPCFRGSESDVLERFYHAAQWIGADHVIRITSDCPLVDPEVVGRVIGMCVEEGCDYVSNVLELSFPHGLDAEAFTMLALERAHREAKLPSEREHVTPYIWKNAERFSLRAVRNGEDLAHLRWTVDELEDMVFARAIYGHLYRPGQVFSMADVCALLAERPELKEINRRHKRDPNYYRDIKEAKE